MRRMALLFTLLALSLSADTGQRSRFSGEYSGGFAAPARQVWSALLLTLEQSSMRIDQLDRRRFFLRTDGLPLTLLADMSKDGDPMKIIRGERVTYLSTWERRLAIWEATRYSCDVLLRDEGRAQTKLTLKSKIETYERNTTKKWHLFASTGVLEKAFLSLLHENLRRILAEKDPNVPAEADLMMPARQSSGKAERTVTAEPGLLWILLPKILADNGFAPTVVNEDVGVIVCQPRPLSSADAKRVMTKDLLGQRKKSWLDIWSEDYRARVWFRTAPLPDPRSTQVICHTSLERYESNAAHDWIPFTSTGHLENELIAALESALKAAGSVDKYEFALVHVSPERKQIFERPVSAVWRAAIYALKNRSLRVKRLSVEPAALTVVTEFSASGGVGTALQFSLRQLPGERTEVAMSVAKRRQTDTGTIEYFPADENAEDVFFQELQKQPETPGTPKVAPCMDESVRGGLFQDSELQRLLDVLQAARTISALPAFEFYENGFRLELDGSESILSAKVHISDPIESEHTLSKNAIARLVADRFLFQFAFALDQSLSRLRDVSRVGVTVVFRFYDLEDGTPIEPRYRNLRIDTRPAQLVKYARREVSAEDLLRESTVLLDGERIDFIDQRSVPSGSSSRPAFAVSAS